MTREEFEARLQAIKDSSSHFLRLVKYVELHKRELAKKYGEKPLPETLLKTLGESYIEDHYPLCKYCKKVVEGTGKLKCSCCPVFKETKLEHCAGTYFFDMVDTPDWERWMFFAKREITFLRNLYIKEKKRGW